MNLELFESECRVPILVGLDCGMSGAIVMNDSEGNVSQIKMPTADKGIDLYAIASLLRGVDMVLMEKPPLGGFSGHTRVTENSCFSQFKELYGLFCGAEIPFHTITPKDWQKFLGFPAKKSVGDDKVWKQFLHAQACQRFPNQKGLTLYAADAFLLHHILSKLWYIDTTLWP